MPVYTMELTDGRKIKLEAADEKQAVEAAELFEKGGQKALDARYGDMSYANAAGARAVAGATASLSAPIAAGMDYLADNTIGRLMGNQEGRSFNEYLAASRAKLNNARDNAGVGWEIAGGVGGAFIPGMNAGRLVQGGTGGMNALGRIGLGAAEGATYAGVQAASEGDDVVDAAKRGALMGGAFNAAAQGARKVLSPAQQKLAGMRKSQVNTLRDAGVTPPASAVTGSSVLGRFEQQAAGSMGGGGKDVSMRAREQFTRAIAKKLDNSVDDVTEVGPDFWNRIGQKFDDGYDELRRSGQVVVDSSLQQRLASIRQMALDEGLTDSQLKSLDNEIGRITRSRIINGTAYQEIHRDLGDRIRRLKNGEMRGVLAEVQSSLADAFRAGDPQLADRVAQMRRDYRLYKQVEKAVDPRSGQIDPNKLFNSVRRSEGDRRFLRGEGELTPLANAGSSLLRKESSSGTAENAATMATIGGIGGGIGAAATGNIPLAAGLLAAPAARYAAGAAGTSNMGQRYLANDMASGPYARAMADRIGAAATRGAVVGLTPEQRRLLGR